jgi:hypothetical protein
VSALGVVSPGYPFSQGGVTDHTARLEHGWRHGGHTVRILSAVDVDPGTVAATWADAGVTAALIQYVPFLYARRGLSAFPRRFALAAHQAGVRVTTFVHEPWVPPTRLPWLVLGPLQRLQLLRLVKVSDAVATPVPAWSERFEGASVLYVGSTLGEPEHPPLRSPELPSPVVFSPFAAGLRWPWIVDAVRAIGAGLIVIGADRATALEHPIVAPLVADDWDFRGRLPARDVLSLLARARLVLAPFVDGLTGRRTSALAALSTGARLLTSDGHLVDPTLVAGPAILGTTREGYARAAVECWEIPQTPDERERQLAWYQALLNPRALDHMLLTLMLGS